MPMRTNYFLGILSDEVGKLLWAFTQIANFFEVSSGVRGELHKACDRR